MSKTFCSVCKEQQVDPITGMCDKCHNKESNVTTPVAKTKRIRKPAAGFKHDESNLDIPEPDPRYTGILEYIRQINPRKEWDAIKAWIQEMSSTISDIRLQIQKGADIEARAVALLTDAKAARGDYDDKFRDRVQIWKRESLLYWESEKTEGLHKQITNDMIEDHIIEMHSDLYLSMKKKARDLLLMVQTFEELKMNVSMKRADLRRMIDSEGKKPSTQLPNWMGDK